MHLSLAQFDVDQGNIQSNLSKIEYFAESAAKEKAALLCLPEMATTGFNWERNRKLSGVTDGQVISLSTIAQRHRIGLCGSFLQHTDEGKAENTLFYFDREGACLARYRKIHLFTLFREEKHVAAGDQVCVVPTALGQTGFGICYDLRFPELFRKNTELGAEVQILPAAFPHPRLAHWQTLVRARALENQSFFIAVNQTGSEGPRGEEGDIRYFGHSMVVDPWGEVLLEAGEAEELLFLDMDLAEVGRVRSKLTAWEDRRPELFH